VENCEIEDLEMVPKELRELQLVILDMLIELDKICRKHNIKYTIVAGTLLGAVRHRGFIPWDDDADVAMLREDYIKFRDVCETELDADKYFFQDHTTDKDYRWGYARIRRKNTKFIRKGQEHLKMRTGIFLDIFPSDNIPDFYPSRLLHCFFCFVFRKILYSEVGKITEKNKLKKILYKILNVIPLDTIFRVFEKSANKHNAKVTKFNRTYAFPPRAGIWLGTPRVWDTDVTDIWFEGHLFSTTLYYERYLEWRFGDYMRFPPPEKRHWHPAALIEFPKK
jgi:lipopolysaccharide cholinephosphotransferase